MKAHRRRAARSLLPLTALVVASAALHAAAFAALQFAQRPDTSPRRIAPATQPAVRVTLAPTVPIAADAPVAPPEQPTEPVIAALPQRPYTAPASVPPAPGALPALPLLEPLAPLAPLALAAAPPALPSAFDPGASYLRLGELSARPMLVTPIDLDLPPELVPVASGAGRLRMRLLISEHGAIDEVIVDESTLPPPARLLAIERFAAARFKPGELDGRAVRSQITIEVSAGGG